MEPSDPYGAPARRTQWIVSTLAFHYGLDRGVENEIIVLATGLDQYLQEVFHHLDHRGGGRLPEEDFHILCDVLGLDPEEREEVEDPEDLEGPRELSFRLFHSRLCGLFRSRAGSGYQDGGLLVGKDSEHIETQIRLRRPLKRREKPRASGAPVHAPGGCRAGPCTRECYEDIVALEEAEDRVSGLEQENQSLRELVEDMRAALQSSDARCLALQVGLWKSRSGCRAPQTGLDPPQDPGLILSSDDQLQELLHGSRGCRRTEGGVRDRGLEQQLWSSEEMAAMQRLERQALRRRMEEARQAVMAAQRRVKELEEEAAHLPALHAHIKELEVELHRHRSKALQPSSTRAELRRSGSHTQHDRCSPTGRAETTPDKMDEQLFRSVEGQAASDEESDMWMGEEEDQILRRFSCCGESSRCDREALKELMSNCGGCRRKESSTSVQVLQERVSTFHKQLQLKEEGTQWDLDQLKESLKQKLQLKNEQMQLLEMELQLLQAERLRLQQLEEKLVDVLQLLQKLRELKVSRGLLGKLLLSMLESCSDAQLGGARVLQVLDVLRQQLAACEVLWRMRWSPDQRRPPLELRGSDAKPAGRRGFGSSQCGAGWS